MGWVLRRADALESTRLQLQFVHARICLCTYPLTCLVSVRRLSVGFAFCVKKSASLLLAAFGVTVEMMDIQVSDLSSVLSHFEGSVCRQSTLVIGS